VSDLLKAFEEADYLLSLIQCAECSEQPLSAEDAVGWMPGICPGCQADEYVRIANAHKVDADQDDTA